MDPCGTPQRMGAGGEVNNPIFTEKGLNMRQTTVKLYPGCQQHTRVDSEEYCDQQYQMRHLNLKLLG